TPSGPDCPVWERDIRADQEREFSAALRAAIGSVDQTALLAYPTVQVILDWHRTLFRQFVPLEYYAGNFRQDDPRRICLGVPVFVGGIEGTLFQVVIRRMDNLTRNTATTFAQA